LRCAAVVVTGVAMIAPGAHLYEFAHEIAMNAPDYFVVQRIYQGWWIAGLALPAALLLNAALAIAERRNTTVCGLAGVAAAQIAPNLITFTVWTQSAKSATPNWTVLLDEGSPAPAVGMVVERDHHVRRLLCCNHSR
jgi:GNAT superfamily N-acetyltransferase